MIKESMLGSFVTLPMHLLISAAVDRVAASKYGVVVDANERPVALTAQRDLTYAARQGDVTLRQAVEQLPPALVAGRYITIERLGTAAAIAQPNLSARGTVLIDAHGVAGVLPVENLIAHLRTRGPQFGAAISRIYTLSGTIGSSVRTSILPGSVGSSVRPSQAPGALGEPYVFLWACAICGYPNELDDAPGPGETMPWCQNPEPPVHRLKLDRTGE